MPKTPKNATGLTPDSEDNSEVKDTSVTPTDENSVQEVDTEESTDVESNGAVEADVESEPEPHDVLDNEGAPPVEDEPASEPESEPFYGDDDHASIAEANKDSEVLSEDERPEVAQPGEVQPNNASVEARDPSTHSLGELGPARTGTPVPEQPYEGASNSPEAEVNPDQFNPQAPVDGKGYEFYEPDPAEDVPLNREPEPYEPFANEQSPETQTPEQNLATRDNIVQDDPAVVSDARELELTVEVQSLRDDSERAKAQKDADAKTINALENQIAELQHKLAVADAKKDE